MTKRVFGTLALGAMIAVFATVPAAADIMNTDVVAQLSNKSEIDRNTLRAWLEANSASDRDTLRAWLEANSESDRNILRAQLEAKSESDRDTLRAWLENKSENDRDTLRAWLEANSASDRDIVLDALAASERAAIESACLMKKPLAVYYLPMANGGRLEDVATFVQEAIDNVLASGESVFQAQSIYNAASTQQGFGNYKTAYLKYCTAYCQAVSINPMTCGF